MLFCALFAGFLVTFYAFFVEPFWLPPGSGEYVSGWYGLADSKLYVSRGIGTSILSARLFARPEIAFFKVEALK